MPAASYEVRLTLGAEKDLQTLHDHIFEYRSPAQADALLSALLEAVESLERFPDRGVVPKELAGLGIRDYRQILLPPYRIIYRVGDVTVVVRRAFEVVDALKSLSKAYDIYFASINDYNRAQFRLYRSLGYPAEILTCERTPGPVLPVDTTRPSQMSPVCTPDPAPHPR